MNGRGELGGWEWVSSMYRRIVCYPEKPPLGIDYTTPITDVTSDSARKAQRLEKLVKKLSCWRESQIEQRMVYELKNKCYSPSCGMTTSSIDGVKLKCYCCQCPNENKTVVTEIPINTSGIAKAFDPVRRKLFELELKEKCFE